MSTQLGDSQKSLLSYDVCSSDFLFDSASDLLHATGAAEMVLEHKRSDALECAEESLVEAEDQEGVDAFAFQPMSVDSDCMVVPLLEEGSAAATAATDAIKPHCCGSYHLTQMLPCLGPSASWCTEDTKKLEEGIWSTLDPVFGSILEVSGASSSGTTGSSTQLARPTQGTRSVGTSSLAASGYSQGIAESSIQTSTRDAVDGHGFIISEGLVVERSPPFVHYDPPSDRRATRRNAKWRVMMEDAEDNWGDICRLQSKLLKKRVRKGIPHDWRYRTWPLLTGGRMLKQDNPNVYARLVRGYSEWEARIAVDVNRTLPRHIFFAENDGAGQRSLFNCLKAYSLHDPEVGYVQGMGSLMAPLLIVMSEEDAFWTFAALMREEAPFPRPTSAGPHPACRRLFLEGLPLTTELGSKLAHLLREKLPHIEWLIYNQGLGVSDFSAKWWMTLFCFVLPFEHVLRVWDIFFFEGWKMALRTGLAIFKCMELQIMELNPDEYLMSLLEPPNLPQALPSPDKFIKTAISLKISKSLQTWAG